MDTNGAGSAPHDALLVDTGVLRIEELKGPDQLPDHNKKLQGYGDARGALQPTTGDQVVFRIKEVGGGSSSSDAAGVRDTTSQGGAAATFSSSASPPKASGPQLAVLGSPQVPVGVSSALGYLHLGQVARVKVPPHLMDQTVTDVKGTIEDTDSTTGTASGPGKPAADTAAPSHSSPTPQPGAPAHDTDVSSSSRTDRGAPSKDQQPKARQQQQQLGGAVPSHPIDVIEAAQQGAVAVHPSGGSPGGGSHRRHRLLPHKHQQHAEEDTPEPGAASASAAHQPGHSRQFSDPVIVRPRGWLEKQQQQQQQFGSSSTASSTSMMAPAAGAGPATPRTSRVAAAAAHAAAAQSQEGPSGIRRAVAAAMGQGQGVPSAAPRLAPPGAQLTSVVPQGNAASPGRRPPPPAAAAGQYGALASPIVSGAQTSGPAASSPSASHSSAAALRPSPSPAVLPASPAVSGSSAGRPPLADSAAAGALTSNSSSAAGTPSSATVTGPQGLLPAGRSVSPVGLHRTPSPGLTGSSSSSRGRYSSSYSRPGLSDRAPTPGKTRIGSSGSTSGPQGVAFSKLSPQPSSEDAPLPATPHPSPAVDSILTAQQQQQPGGGVQGLVGRLAQQPGLSGTGSSRGPAEGTPLTQGASGAPAVSPAAAAAGEVHRGSAGSTAAAGASSSTSGSHAGFSTPPAATGYGATPFYTPASLTPVSTVGSDANSTVTGGSTVSSNSINSVTQGSRQGPPPRSLMTLEGLRSPGGATATGSTAPTAQAADALFGATAGSAGSATAPVRTERGHRPTGVAAVLPLQQGGRLSGEDAAEARGTQAAAAARPSSASTARQLRFGASGQPADAAAAGHTSSSSKVRGHHHDSTAVLQAAADKLRSTYGAVSAAEDSTSAADGGPRAAASGTKPGVSSSSSGAGAARSSGADPSLLRDILAAGRRDATDSTRRSDPGLVSFNRWLPQGTSSGSREASGSVTAPTAAAPDARKSGSSDSAAGSTGSRDATTAREAAAMAAALQPGFVARSTGASSGVTATISTVDELSGEALNLQNYPAARHRVESFGNLQVGSQLEGSWAGSQQGATAAASDGAAEADRAAAAAGTGAVAGTAVRPGLDTQGAAASGARSGPSLVSPSKAAAAAALASYSAVEAGAPAAPAADTTAATAAGSPRGAAAVPALPMLQLYTKTAQVVPPAAATSSSGTAVYMRPVEEALMPGRSSSSYTGHRSSSSSSFTAQQGSSHTGAHGPQAVPSTAEGKDQISQGAAGAGSRDVGAAGPDQGGRAEGAGSTVATVGAGGEGQVPGDGRVEYEVEVLAVIPGHGDLSGQPVLSQAAQQEQGLTAHDVRAAAAELAAAQPQLQPPKPRKGFSGWVRRHLSLNVDAPRRAGKKGAGAVGLRGCWPGGGGSKKKQQDTLQ